MTPAQQRELKRLTPLMWTILGYAKRCSPPVDDVVPAVGGVMLRASRILERRGFITVHPPTRPGGWHVIELTEAGYEAMKRPSG
jgi:hypothetical protein